MKDTTLTVAAFNPFTGPDASFGPEMMAGCLTAAAEVNAAGGVLTNKVACSAVDRRCCNPADGVTAAAKMLATTPHLLGGCWAPSGDEAGLTAPLINAAKILMFADTGQASFDRTTLPYFWRMTPADDVQGAAMALYAKQKGYLRGAAVFGSDIGSQGSVPTLLKAYSALGGQIVLNQKIALNQASYQPEVEQLIAAKPQVIFTEASPQANATYFAELQQLSHLIPVIGSDATLSQTAWLSAMTAAIGKPALSKYFTGATPYAAASGPRVAGVQQVPAGHSPGDQAGRCSGPTTRTRWWTTTGSLSWRWPRLRRRAPIRPYGMRTSRRSPRPPRGRWWCIRTRTALRRSRPGKKIDYVGATGLIVWNQYHNSTGEFEVQGYQPNGSTPSLGLITAADLAPLLK